MARAASAGSTPPRPVPMPGMAITSKPWRAAASSAARVARRTFSTPIFVPGCSIVGAWMTCLAHSWPPLVTTAAPTAMGARDMASRCTVGPPLRDSAAATPPPMIPSELAGLTTASTAIAVMSLLARCICISRVGPRRASPAGFHRGKSGTLQGLHVKRSERGRRLPSSFCAAKKRQGFADIFGGVARALVRNGPVLMKQTVELLLDLARIGRARDRQLLHDQAARGVQHAPLAEGEGLESLQAVEIAEDLRHLEQRPRFDLLHETAIAPVPGLAVDVDLLVAEDLHHLLDLCLAGNGAQAHLVGLVGRHQDSQAAVHRPQDVEALDLAKDLFVLDPDDLGDAL